MENNQETKKPRNQDVKCQYCGKVRQIKRPGQKTFLCCGHYQAIGKRTIINADSSTNAIAGESKAGETPLNNQVGRVDLVIEKEVETPKSTSSQIQEVNGGKGATETHVNTETQTPQTSLLEVVGTLDESKPEIKPKEEIINKCGSCGAIVDKSLICGSCGEDYNG